MNTATAIYQKIIIGMLICLMIIGLPFSNDSKALTIEKIRNDRFSFNASELINGKSIQSLSLGDTQIIVNNNIIDIQPDSHINPFKNDIKKQSRRNIFRVKFDRNEIPCNAALDVQVRVEDPFGNPDRLSDPSNSKNSIGVDYEPYEHRRRCYNRDGGIRRIIYRFDLRINDLSSAGNTSRYSGTARMVISYP